MTELGKKEEDLSCGLIENPPNVLGVPPYISCNGVEMKAPNAWLDVLPALPIESLDGNPAYTSSVAGVNAGVNSWSAEAWIYPITRFGWVAWPIGAAFAQTFAHIRFGFTNAGIRAQCFMNPNFFYVNGPAIDKRRWYYVAVTLTQPAGTLWMNVDGVWYGPTAATAGYNMALLGMSFGCGLGGIPGGPTPGAITGPREGLWAAAWHANYVLTNEDVQRSLRTQTVNAWPGITSWCFKFTESLEVIRPARWAPRYIGDAAPGGDLSLADFLPYSNRSWRWHDVSPGDGVEFYNLVQATNITGAGGELDFDAHPEWDDIFPRACIEGWCLVPDGTVAAGDVVLIQRDVKGAGIPIPRGGGSYTLPTYLKDGLVSGHITLVTGRYARVAYLPNDADDVTAPPTGWTP